MRDNGIFRRFFVFLSLSVFSFYSCSAWHYTRGNTGLLKNSRRSDMDTQVSSDSNYTGPDIDVDSIMHRFDRLCVKNNKKENLNGCTQDSCFDFRATKSSFERMLDFICCVLERSDNLCKLAVTDEYHEVLVPNNFLSNNEKFATLRLGNKKIVMFLEDNDLISGKNRKNWNESVRNAFREVEYDENEKSVRFSEVYYF